MLHLTVVLFLQQARVIEQFTDFNVGVYSGDDAKHLKTHVAWERELEQYEVCDILFRVDIATLSLCCLIVFVSGSCFDILCSVEA